MTFEETQQALDELITQLPPEIFAGLNCGVTLLEETLYDNHGLLILGQYHVQPFGLGRYITIYYGSLMENYAHLNAPKFIKKLRGVLHHELTHHLEHQAGDRTLEIEDELEICRFRQQKTHDS